jgi:YD repeat-containing protein
VLGRPRGERPSCRGLGSVDLRSSLHHVPNPVRGADHAGTTLSGHTRYDDNGNLTVREDGRDNDWIFAYDLFDRLIQETDPLGHY